jgi:hypothetical protein
MGARSVRYSPWRHLRALGHVRLDFTDDDRLLDGADARYYATVDRLIMDRRLGLQVDRRCVLAHELGHAVRGDLPCGEGVLDARQEAFVDQWAARRLIELPALADALAWSRQPDEVADALWVTPAVLEVRMRHLYPAERAYLLSGLSCHTA